jgi:hypothetical protein
VPKLKLHLPSQTNAFITNPTTTCLLAAVAAAVDALQAPRA